MLRVLPETKELKELISEIEQTRLNPLLDGSSKGFKESFSKTGQTDIDVFGTNLLEVMQFVMNHTTFDPSVEMDRALLAAYEPLGVIPGKVYNPTEVPKIDLPYFREVAQQLIAEAKTKEKDLRAQEHMVFQRYASKGKIDLETELVQSVVSPVGLPSNEMLYFSLLVKDEQPFNAQYDYILRMNKDELPPSIAWSVTLCGLKNGLLIPNEQKKYSIDSISGVKGNAEGVIEIVISSKKPEGVSEENWLPTKCEDKDLDLLLRLYVPDLEKIKLGWKTPLIELIS